MYIPQNRWANRIHSLAKSIQTIIDANAQIRSKVKRREESVVTKILKKRETNKTNKLIPCS